MQFRIAFSLVALVVMGMMSACSNSRSNPACTPGTAEACMCSNGAAGTQMCGSDGLPEVCDCALVDTDSGVSLDGGTHDLGSAPDLGSSPDGSVVADGSVTLDMRIAVLDMAVITTDAATDVDAGTDLGVGGCATTADCNDLNACTADQCLSAVCVHVPVSADTCDDGNFCTTDSCAPATGCVHTNNSLSCDDGRFCSQGDHCSAGECVGGGVRSCGGGCVCDPTDDECVPVHPGAVCI